MRSSRDNVPNSFLSVITGSWSMPLLPILSNAVHNSASGLIHCICSAGITACRAVVVGHWERGTFLIAGRVSRPTTSESLMITKRSEEHTSELQSHSDLVCRLLLEK